jgi:hypothetical protein
MRWQPKSKPKESEWRIIVRFAWLPVLTSLPTKQYVWLEFYKVNQQYRHWCFQDGIVIRHQYKWIDQQIAPYEYWSSNE